MEGLVNRITGMAFKKPGLSVVPSPLSIPTKVIFTSKVTKLFVDKWVLKTDCKGTILRQRITIYVQILHRRLPHPQHHYCVYNNIQSAKQLKGVRFNQKCWLHWDHTSRIACVIGIDTLPRSCMHTNSNHRHKIRSSSSRFHGAPANLRQCSASKLH